MKTTRTKTGYRCDCHVASAGTITIIAPTREEAQALMLEALARMGYRSAA